MDRSFLIQLTNEIYRLTLLFPKKEPLRYKMRELADDILTNCLTPGVKPNSVLENLEVLDGFFEVAKNQNWVKKEELLNLQKEYGKLKSFPQQKLAEVWPRSVAEEHKKTWVGPRQEKILAFLKEKEKVQVWQIKQIFPQVSKRTLRRDFENLFKRGIIERIGERNETYYTRARQSRAKGGEEDLSSSTQLKEG